MLLVRGWANRALPPRKSVERQGSVGQRLPFQLRSYSPEQAWTGTGPARVRVPPFYCTVSREKLPVASHRIAQHTHTRTRTAADRQTDRQSYCGKEAQLERGRYTPSSSSSCCCYPQSPPRTDRGEGRGMGRPPLLSCESMVIPKSRQTRKKGPRRPGEGIGGAAQRVVGHVHPFVAHRGKGKEEGEKTRPTACRGAHSSSVFFCRCCPALPVMRIIPASRRMASTTRTVQRQRQRHKHEGERALSRPRRRGRPFRQHLVRPGCRRGTVVSM